MYKVIPVLEEAIADIRDGAMIAIGGFFAAGVPRLLLQALINQGTKGLTLISGTGALLGAAEQMQGLLRGKQINKIIDSYALARSATKGLKDPFEQAVKCGEVELEVWPMGTLAEKLRAASAGIPAFYNFTGAGSVVEEAVITNRPENATPKEVRMIDGRKCILEYALRPDYAFVHAFMGDEEGNLSYRKTARNFNHVMAAAGRVTIAEVEHLVPPGGIDPELVHTPGIYVQRIVRVDHITHPITID